MADIVERLREEALALQQTAWSRMDGGQQCSLNASLAEEAADEIERLQRVIAWANNSLYGSHGFFLSMNGGEPDEHHLDRAIEDLKERNRKLYAELSTARRTALLEAAEMVDALPLTELKRTSETRGALIWEYAAGAQANAIAAALRAKAEEA